MAWVMVQFNVHLDMLRLKHTWQLCATASMPCDLDAILTESSPLKFYCLPSSCFFALLVCQWHSCNYAVGKPATSKRIACIRLASLACLHMFLHVARPCFPASRESFDQLFVQPPLRSSAQSTI